MRKIIIIVVVAIIVIILFGVAIYFIVKCIRNRHKTVGGGQGYNKHDHASWDAIIKKDNLKFTDEYRTKLKLLSKRNLINFTFDSIEYMPFTISYLYNFYIKDKDISLGMTTEEQKQLSEEKEMDTTKVSNVKFFHSLFYGMLFFTDDTLINTSYKKINTGLNCEKVNELELKSYFNGMTMERFNKIINGNTSKTPREIKF